MIILVYITRIDAVIGIDPATVPVGSEEADRFNAIVSATAAVQNMCMAAHSNGLGNIWMSLPRRNCHAISELLGIKDMELVAGVLMGYAARRPSGPAHPVGRLW